MHRLHRRVKLPHPPLINISPYNILIWGLLHSLHLLLHVLVVCRAVVTAGTLFVFASALTWTEGRERGREAERQGGLRALLFLVAALKCSYLNWDTGYKSSLRVWELTQVMLLCCTVHGSDIRLSGGACMGNVKYLFLQKEEKKGD